MNKGIFIGNVGSVPEIKQLKEFTVLKFNLAVNIGYKENKETMWVNCTIWGKRATSIQPLIYKGARIFVSGRIKMEQYYAKNGEPKTNLNMDVDDIEIMSKLDKKLNSKDENLEEVNEINLDDDIPF